MRASTANQTEHVCRPGAGAGGLRVMCFQLLLPSLPFSETEKQEPRKHSVMATLVLGAHGKRRGEEAMLDSG